MRAESGDIHRREALYASEERRMLEIEEQRNRAEARRFAYDTRTALPGFFIAVSSNKSRECLLTGRPPHMAEGGKR